MSTRTTIWTLLLSTLVVVLIVFFVTRDRSGWTEGTGQKRPDGGPSAIPTANPPSPVGAPQWKAEGVWPMFHGGQGLLGRAEGHLAAALTVRWKFKTQDAVKSSPGVSEGRVFVGSCDENIYALDLASGQKLWSYKTGGSVEAAPCVLAARVFMGSADNCLYALDAGTGELKWKYETEGQILGSANWTRSPDGRRTWILVGSYDNKVHCVDSETGRPVWVYETGNYINGSPAVADGRCVFGGCDALIHVVSVADGTKVTEIDSGSYIAASAAFVEGQVYVGNYGNVFLRADLKEGGVGMPAVTPAAAAPADRNNSQGYADSATDGENASAAGGQVVWEYAASDAPFFSSPAVGEDNGEKVWTFKTLGEVNSSPALCGDKVVVGSDDGRLYLLAGVDGRQLWSYEMGQPVTSSPAVAGGMVVVGCDDGYVYAFGPKAGEGGLAGK
jgi:outer membrane protein assembly factor BamB